MNGRNVLGGLRIPAWTGVGTAKGRAQAPGDPCRERPRSGPGGRRGLLGPAAVREPEGDPTDQRAARREREHERRGLELLVPVEARERGNVGDPVLLERRALARGEIALV